MPEKVVNHFDEFCKFVRSQKWMSTDFGTELIRQFMNGQIDAYNRGEQHGKSLH